MGMKDGTISPLILNMHGDCVAVQCRPSWISKIVWSGPRDMSVTTRRKSILITSAGPPPCETHSLLMHKPRTVSPPADQTPNEALSVVNLLQNQLYSTMH